MFLRVESDVQVNMHFLDEKRDLIFFLRFQLTLTFFHLFQTFMLMEETAQFCNGHYQLPLPWRVDYLLLSDNLIIARKRLSGLKRRMPKTRI